MTDTAEKAPIIARLGRWVFPRRLLVPLPIVVLGLLIIRPRGIFGGYELAGMMGSACLVLLGMALRIWAGGSAGSHTRTDSIEAPRLVTGGPYAYVRNPIYLGSVILSLGMIGVVDDPWMLALAVPAFVSLWVMLVPAEEEFLRRQFGARYAAYCHAVPRMLPRLRPWPERRETAFDWSVLRGEAWIVFYLATIYCAMKLAEHLRS